MPSMSRIFPSLVFGLAFAIAAAPAYADVLLTPTVGFRSGSADFFAPFACAFAIGVPCPEDAELDDGETFGLILGVERGERWRFEIAFDRQAADLEVDFAPCEACLTIPPPREELEILTLQVGGLRRWPGQRVHPFVAARVGVSRLTADEDFGAFDIDEERPSASLGAGVEVPLGGRLDLRLEARGLWVDLPSEVAEDDLVQGEVVTGLAFRW
ncbi:MAG: outer membrane beta-barrel protein [Acidobacteriota bacterium]